jgi:hypothetical protein
MTDQEAGWSPLRVPASGLRIGVSGHRGPPKLPLEAVAEVRSSVERVLSAIADAAHQREAGVMLQKRGREAVRCTVISPLAEGADRIVAEAGLAAGFSLEAILPLDKTEYIKDFTTAESRAAFDRLLQRAASVLTLDGSADERPRAYEAAGFAMLANVDLLIAIWDGNDAEGIGGTGEIVNRAIADGIPVVWIVPENPHVLRLSWSLQQEGVPAIANATARGMFSAVEAADVAGALARALFPT